MLVGLRFAGDAGAEFESYGAVGDVDNGVHGGGGEEVLAHAGPGGEVPPALLLKSCLLLEIGCLSQSPGTRRAKYGFSGASFF